MGRPKKSGDGHGHNSGIPLPDEDRAALSVWHQLKINEAQRAADKIKATYDEAREVVNQQFALAKGGLGYDRKQFAELIRLSRMTEVALQASENARTSMLIEGGLKPPGTQLELALGDTVDDMEMARREGYRVGKRGEDFCEPPETLHPACIQSWTAGFHEGQAENAPLILRAEAIFAERNKPAVSLDEDGDGEDEEDGLDPDVVAKKARKLKKEGWTEPTPEEASLAQVAA